MVKSSNNQRKRKLTWQLLPIIFVGFAVILIADAFVLYFQALEMLRGEKRRMSEIIDGELNRRISTEVCLEELVDYWMDNAYSMNIVYDDPEYLAYLENQYVYDFRDMNWELMNKYGNFNKWPEEDKLFYAEYKMMDWTCFFDDLKEDFEPSYLYMMRRVGDEDFEFIIAGKNSREYRSPDNVDANGIYTIGKIQSYDKEVYRELYESYETGVASWLTVTGDELSKHSRYMFCYPIVRQGNTLGMVIVENSYSKLIGEFMTMLVIFILVIMSVIAVTAVCIAWVVRKRVILPIKIIDKGMIRFGNDTDVSELEKVRDDVKSQNEIGSFANSLCELGRELVEHIDKVKQMTSQEERLNAEMEVAAGIQASVLPKDFESINKKYGLDVYAVSRPARNVGGDLYSFCRIDDDHIALIVGDVSGKGIPAALFMMSSKIMLESEAQNCTEPHEILERVNNRMCQENDMNMFITVFVGILEVSTGILKIANGGHELTLIKHSDGSVEKTPEKHGLVLASMEGMEYVTYEVQMKKGDVLIQYTDGITEATDSEGKMYGMDRLIKELEECTEVSVDKQVDSLISDVNDFVGNAEQFDDMTVAMLRYDTDNE